MQHVVIDQFVYDCKFVLCSIVMNHHSHIQKRSTVTLVDLETSFLISISSSLLLIKAFEYEGV